MLRIRRWFGAKADKVTDKKQYSIDYTRLNVTPYFNPWA